MKAYEFLSHDRAGLALSGTTDDGYCEWIGTSEQWSNADYYMMYFSENEYFPKEETYE